MQKIQFTKVVIKSFTRTSTNGTAKIMAALTAPVVKKMAWGELPDWQKSSQPTGKLSASVLEFTPKQDELAKHAFDLGVGTIDSFEIVRKEAKGKAAKRTKATMVELTFNVHFLDPQGAKKLEMYMLTCPESTLSVSYEIEPEQGELPGTEEGGEGDALQQQVLDITRKRATSKAAD